jgi:hypothetical protein
MILKDMTSNESAIRKRKNIENSSSKCEDKSELTDKNEKDKIHLKDFEKEYSNLKPKRGQYYLTRIVLVRFTGFIYGRIHV